MKVKIEDSNRLNILGNCEFSSKRKSLAAMLKHWKQKLSYYSIFAALPAILTSHSQEIQAQEAKKTEVSVAGQTTRLVERRDNSLSNPELLRRRSNYLFPYQKDKYSNIISELAGGDNCPGTTIPGGTYTSTAPFTDSGNTTGANNTVNRLTSYYYYSYNADGPDQIYSFTLTGIGPNPKIQVTATSATYKPMIYILGGDFGTGCPAGTNNSSSNWYSLSYSPSPGGAATLDSQQLNWLPLNVPFYLLVDSAVSGANDSGPYTLRIQDVTIAPAAPPRTKFDFDGDGKADISVFRPLDKTWYLNRSTLGFSSTQFGLSTDKIVPADFDGDSKTDIAVFRDGNWYWLFSQYNYLSAVQFGLANDIPVPSDFTGDGRSELVVYRNGVWYLRDFQNNQFSTVQFGLSTDKPIASDYDSTLR